MQRALLFIFCLVTCHILAQNQEVKILDSIDRSIIELTLKKADDFYKTNLDSALYYINEAKSLIEPYDDVELKAKSLLYQSKYLLYKREYGNIIPLLQPNINNYRLLSYESLGRTYKDIGHAYKQEWIPDSALVNYIKALKCFEKSGNNRDISLTYLSLGLVYSKMGNKELSSDFYDKSMAYSENSEVIKMHKERITDQPIRPVTYQGTINLSLDIAKIAQERGDKRLLAVTYSDIKKDYFRIKDYNKALEYAEKELVIRNETKFTSTIPVTQYFIGNIHLINNDYGKAIDKFNDALPKATDSLKLSIYKGLKSAYVNTGNTKEALKYMELYDVLKDSINISKTKATIAEITSKYNDEQQKQEIQTLNFQNKANAEKISNQRLTLFSIIAVSALLLLLGVFIYRNYRSKQELNYSQLNFKLLQTQLNPHFMFNALNEIKLNLDSKDAKKSSEHLTAYSKLMRLILEGSNEDFVTLQDDISLISNFLQLQQLVYNHSFDYDIEVDDNLDLNYLKFPPMLTQPYVENAIIHGVKQIENGEIKINYAQNNDAIVVTISDNGKGIVDSKTVNGKALHKSLGTTITKQRLKNYKSLYNFNIETKTENSNGTHVTITCPIQTV
ncbi:histidine kinase [Winogradskyella sp. 3972H.M.0a.05]|uniref:tetratricopeptide repeat-containing sensor histidine kinase n=1 Tax=Winogradskyella sp. 3972H.M.0a.05 TaxID=2950277 RepID=UPI0033962143